MRRARSGAELDLAALQVDAAVAGEDELHATGGTEARVAVVQARSGHRRRRSGRGTTTPDAQRPGTVYVTSSQMPSSLTFVLPVAVTEYWNVGFTGLDVSTLIFSGVLRQLVTSYDGAGSSVTARVLGRDRHPHTCPRHRPRG